MKLINENTFDKTFNTVVRVLPIPEIAEEVIIATKDFLKNEEVREKIKDIFDNTLNKDGRIIKNISQIKDTIKEEGLKEVKYKVPHLPSSLLQLIYFADKTSPKVWQKY